MESEHSAAISRRDLLWLIGAVAGSAAIYQVMTSLGFTVVNYVRTHFGNSYQDAVTAEGAKGARS